ncbi:MAG: hypothetical protein MJZ00_02620 [Paludibacteraceae bacterium]|nr:hypothetical protein [Paludibacteraceae bacterium]
MKQINDPVFGELEYDGVKKGWTKRIPLGIWFGDNFLLDLVVKCDEDEEITDKQRESYKSYLANLSNYSSEVYKVLFSYYKDHYEEFNRQWELPDKLKIDVVEALVTLRFYKPKQLFIDRNGNYGWLSTFISPQYLISVILSDGKPRIFQGWDVFEDFGIVDDDVFGEMYFDNGWRKKIKTDINGIDGEWLLLVADAMFSDDEISPEQKANYQKYLQNEKKFLEEFPDELLDYYQANYDLIKDIWEDADMYDPNSMTPESIKSLIRFKRFYLHKTGNRYGWVCECAWDKVYGLSIFYDNRYKGELLIGTLDDLIV